MNYSNQISQYRRYDNISIDSLYTLNNVSLTHIIA